MVNYYCSNCKLGVIVIEGCEPIKACNCDAVITAEVSVILYGENKVGETKNQPCPDSTD
jgi:hypothetical protein